MYSCCCCFCWPLGQGADVCVCVCGGGCPVIFAGISPSKIYTVLKYHSMTCKQMFWKTASQLLHCPLTRYIQWQKTYPVIRPYLPVLVLTSYWLTSPYQVPGTHRVKRSPHSIKTPKFARIKHYRFLLNLEHMKFMFHSRVISVCKQ